MCGSVVVRGLVGLWVCGLVGWWVDSCLVGWWAGGWWVGGLVNWWRAPSLQHLFAKSAPPKRDKSKPAASASAAKKQKAKGVGILDVRRASNVGIMLSKVRSR